MLIIGRLNILKRSWNLARVCAICSAVVFLSSQVRASEIEDHFFAESSQNNESIEKAGAPRHNRLLLKLNEKLAWRIGKILSCQRKNSKLSHTNQKWAEVSEMKQALKEWKASVISLGLREDDVKALRISALIRKAVESYSI